VLAPDAAFAPLVRPLLGHKPSNFRWHIDAAFEPGRIRDLETRFYLGLLDGRPICNIMTVEYRGVGILGHVYTLPAHRRKGACQRVMAEQMADFTRRGGRYMTLGTGYDTPPYWIYHRFGFRSIAPDSGFMKYATQDGFEAAFFAPGGVDIAAPDWKDWPALNVLCAQTDLPFLRSVAYELYGPSNFEGGYLTLMQRMTGRPDVHARLLKTERGAVAGYATLQPDARWHNDTLLLDLAVHPAFIPHAHALLRSLPLPEDRKIQAYAEEEDAWKIAALLEEGFEHEATFRGQMAYEGQMIDVEVYERKL
jgi:GNAT superfamily N-acetyltransferase